MHNVQNAMCAAALAYALGKSLEDIRLGLKTFDTTFFQAPGRMNIYDAHPFKVILDYGHNPAAIDAMCKTAHRMDIKGRRIAVLAMPGDRRDEDIAEIGLLAAGMFDHYLCRADDNRRGRGHDEVPMMLRRVLIDAGVSEDQIEVIPDEQACVHQALQMARPGDLVLMFGDDTTRCWKQITNFDVDEDIVVSESEEDSAATASVDVEEYVLDSSVNLIRDERGVRLAREESD